METFKKVLSVIWTGIKYIAKAIKFILWPLRKAYVWVTKKLTFTKVANITSTSNLIFIGDPSRFFFIPAPYITTSSTALYTTKSYRIGFLIFQLMLDVCTKAVAEPVVASAIPSTVSANGSTYTVKKVPVAKKTAAPVKKTAVKKAAPKVAAKKTVAKKK